ncbi:MAG: hypothetical protein HYR60_01595 [Acidobacteria bacterium]|nr:hypothetical protein [Acidobacteriota bacterium]
MNTPQLPQYGLENLYLFPFYQGRADYKARTGQDAPPFDAAHNVKRWLDPNPQSKSRLITYPLVLARDEKNLPVPDASGAPSVEPLTMTKEEAARVNIPPDNLTATQDTVIPLFEYDCPIRPLLPDEALVFGVLGVVAVRNLTLWREQVAKQSGAFLPSDRATLEAIAKKLGV